MCIYVLGSPEMQTCISGKPVVQFQSQFENQESGELMVQETDVAAQLIRESEFWDWMMPAHTGEGNLL